MRLPSPNIIAAAQGSQRKYGILASTSLAQWADESEWGAKVTGANNYFGVKAPELSIPGRMCWTHETVHGISERVQRRFRDFSDVQSAFDYHGLLIATDPRYRTAYKLRDQLEPYLNALGPVYATGKGYAGVLLELIRDNHLAQFDLPVVARPPTTPATVMAASSGATRTIEVDV